MLEKTLKQNTLTLISVILLIIVAALPVAGETLKENIQAALNAGDTTLAISLLQKEIEIDKTYHYDYYILGRIYYNREQYDQAAAQFQMALEKKDRHWESLEYHGLTLLKLGKLDEAQAAADKGLKKAREAKDKFEYLYGLVMMARKNYVEADKAFRRALAIDDKMANYHIALGDANFYQGVPALAAMEYEAALNLDTASTEVYFHWAEACLELKDYTCAMDKLRLVLSKDSTHAGAWKRAAGIYFKAGLSGRNGTDRQQLFMDAIGAYGKYFELSHAQPDSTTVREYFETAMAYSNIRRYEEAIPYFEKVLSIPYEPRDIYFQYGKALWGIRDYEKAAEMLEKHIAWAQQQTEDFASRVDEAELYKLMGDVYFYRQPKDFAGAARYYEMSLASDSMQDRVLQNAAIALHNLGRYPEAMRYYDRRIAMGIDTATASILNNASLCALKMARPEGTADESLEESEGASTDNPGVDPTRNYYQVAADYWNRYLELVPTDTTALFLLGNTYLYQLQDCQKSVATYERLLTLAPSNCQAKKSLGFAYLMGTICPKDLNRTLRYLLDAHECLNRSGSGTCDDVELAKWIAQAYHLRAVDKTGDANSDFKNAFEWYGRVLKCKPNDVDAKKGQEDTRFEFNE